MSGDIYPWNPLPTIEWRFTSIESHIYWRVKEKFTFGIPYQLMGGDSPLKSHIDWKVEEKLPLETLINWWMDIHIYVVPYRVEGGGKLTS